MIGGRDVEEEPVDITASESARHMPVRTGHSKLAAADRRFGMRLAIPATVIVLLLVGGPSLQTIVYSFQKVSFNGPTPFVGLDNYVRLLNSDEFKESFRITVLYAVGFVLISTSLGLAFAILLN